MSDTPRTDAEENDYCLEIGDPITSYVRADFARTLERELNALIIERDEMAAKLAHLQ